MDLVGQQLHRIVLGVQYHGQNWQGWQKQLHGLTIQNQLESALRQFTVTDIATTCAGRTDTGVHALEQIVHFDTAICRDMSSWVRGVNAFLPASIAVRWACEMPLVTPMEHPDNFHARFSAVARTYHYVLYNHPVRSPLFTGSAGWVFRPLDVDKMQEAAQCLLGTHDFTTFRAAECQAKSPIRTMHSLSVTRHADVIVFTFKANAFLHHMIRNIVGSLIVVGIGKQSPQWLLDVFNKKDRSVAAPTFMPDGLYLARVDYPDKWALPQEDLQGFLPVAIK